MRFRRALPLLLVLLLVLAPMASAESLLGPILADHTNQVGLALERANSTYGERTEFQQAWVSLAQAHASLNEGAWIVADGKLLQAKGGLETGKARAQANGSGDSNDAVERGRQLASQARSQVQQIRNNLESMERTGLEPVAFDGGLTAAYAANVAMDMLEEHEAAVSQWEKGHQNEGAEATIVSSGAGAVLAASIASDVLEETVQKRANASATHLLSLDELDALVQDRVSWVEGNKAPSSQRSRDRVMALAQEDERLMTLSAYTRHFQDLAVNGMNIKHERGEDVDAFATAREVHDRDLPRAEAWVETLGVPGDLALGGLESAAFSLSLNENTTGDSRHQAGIFALGLAHFGAENAGLLQQAYGTEDHVPGTELAEAEVASEGWLASIPSPGALVAVAVLAIAALRVRRETG